MPSNINKIINEFVEKVRQILGENLKTIILYGSYARGDYKKNSDIDIMILTDLDNEKIIEYRNKIWDCAYDYEYENNIVISPLVKNIDYFNSWLDVKPFYMNVMKEGVVLDGKKD